MESPAVGWLKSNNKSVSEFGEIAAGIIGDMYGGIYHVEKEALKTDWSSAYQVTFTVRDVGLGTFDSNLLTRLVILAHQRNAKVSIKGAAPGYVRICIVKVDRSGFLVDAHPAVEDIKGLADAASAIELGDPK